LRIIIVGAGEVGFHLAKILSQERHDIVVIDNNPEHVARVNESLDVMVVEGSGTELKTLKQAEASEANMLIAVTTLDEVNFTSCMLAGKLGVKKKILRVNDPHFLSEPGGPSGEDFGIDLMIYPEGLAAQEIVRLIRRSAATEVLEFAEGRIQLIGIRLDQESPLLNKKLKDIVATYKNLPFRAVAIFRGIRTIIPTGEELFKKGDQVFVISKTEMVPEMLQLAGKVSQQLDKIMILGGSGIGRRVAEHLESEVSIKLIESDKEASAELADVLTKTMVIQGEGKDLISLRLRGSWTWTRTSPSPRMRKTTSSRA